MHLRFGYDTVYVRPGFNIVFCDRFASVAQPLGRRTREPAGMPRPTWPRAESEAFLVTPHTSRAAEPSDGGGMHADPCRVL